MAVFNLAITYPDAQQARILTALRAKVTEAAAGTATPNPTPTNAQAIEWLRKVVLANVRDVVLTYEHNAAVAAAAASVTPVDPT